MINCRMSEIRCDRLNLPANLNINISHISLCSHITVTMGNISFKIRNSTLLAPLISVILTDIIILSHYLSPTNCLCLKFSLLADYKSMLYMVIHS